MANTLNTIEKLIDCFLLQVTNLTTYAVAVGATPADIHAVIQDMENLVYIRDYAPSRNLRPANTDVTMPNDSFTKRQRLLRP